MTARQRRAVWVATWANGILVALIPFWIAWLATAVNTSDPPVRPTDAASVTPLLAFYPPLASVFAALGLLAGWRTHVHARAYVESRSRGWVAILESATLGFGIALWTLRNGIRSRPLDAPPYIIAYGGGAFIVGLVIGVVLRSIAVLILRLMTRTSTDAAT